MKFEISVTKRALPTFLAALVVALPTWSREVDLCRVTGVAPGQIYNRAVAVELPDPLNQPGLELLINGRPYQSGRRLAEEGDYVLELRPSGPLKTSRLCEPVSFTIDRTAPVIDIARPDWLPEGAVPRVQVEDENLVADSVEILLDGQPYDPSSPVRPGKHRLEVSAEDKAGNISSREQVFVQKFRGCYPEQWFEYKTPSNILSAAFYFPWYDKALNGCPSNAFWCNCFRDVKPGNPRPALGYYGSDRRWVVDAHLDQMVAHGIDVVALEWTGMTDEINNIVDHFLPSISSRNLKFVLLYDTFVRLGVAQVPIDFNNATIRDKFINDFNNFASSPSYFKHPKYLKFGNEPVIYIFITRAIVGSDANIVSTFDAAHQAARNHGFAGLYLVADHVFWGPIDWDLLQLTSPRAITSFAPVNPDQGVPEGNQSRPIRTWANKMATLYANARNAQAPPMAMVDFTPGIFVQWNNSGLDSDKCFELPQTWGWNLLDGSDWSFMIQKAGLNQAKVVERHVLRPSCAERVFTTPANGTSIIFTYSFNEWWEGAGIEQLDPRSPAYPYGFGLQPLQLLKQKLP